MNVKKILAITFAILLSLTAFAQRGGGGGGGFGGGGNFGGGGRGGGGGNFGGGGGGFAGGGWGAYNSVPNDSTPLVRLSGSLTFIEGRGANNPIRDDDLKALFDSIMFQSYETEHKRFIRGDNMVSAGVVLYIPTAILTLIAATHKSENDPGLSNKLYKIAGGLAVPATVCYVWGSAKKAKAKHRIQKLADEYNVDMELRKASKAISFEFEPTAFLDNRNNTSFGATLNINF